MVNRVSIEEVRQAVDEESMVLIADIRDANAFAAGHIAGSININQENVDDFMADSDKKSLLIVVCYHGHSSISGAQYFMNQGFLNVASMDGGFEAWKKMYPFVTA